MFGVQIMTDQGLVDITSSTTIRSGQLLEKIDVILSSAINSYVVSTSNPDATSSKCFAILTANDGKDLRAVSLVNNNVEIKKLSDNPTNNFTISIIRYK